MMTDELKEIRDNTMLHEAKNNIRYATLKSDYIQFLKKILMSYGLTESFRDTLIKKLKQLEND